MWESSIDQFSDQLSDTEDLTQQISALDQQIQIQTNMMKQFPRSAEKYCMVIHELEKEKETLAETSFMLPIKLVKAEEVIRIFQSEI